MSCEWSLVIVPTVWRTLFTSSYLLCCSRPTPKSIQRRGCLILSYTAGNESWTFPTVKTLHFKSDLHCSIWIIRIQARHEKTRRIGIVVFLCLRIPGQSLYKGRPDDLIRIKFFIIFISFFTSVLRRYRKSCHDRFILHPTHFTFHKLFVICCSTPYNLRSW